MASFLSTIILFIVCACCCQAQQPLNDIYVEGWKTGNKTSEQLFTFDLDASQKLRTADVRDSRQVHYKLVLTKYPPGKEDDQLEYWVVELKPVILKRNKREALGHNLLTKSGFGPGGDYFPREDLAAILYPQEAPKDFLEKIRQPNGGYYPVSVRRVIKVENFYVVIKVVSFKLSERQPKTIESMQVSVQFTNSYLNGNASK